ncbi:MAG TPA: tRNA 2-thiocytidine biosynthesis TtcA family protein [Bacillota bacterium]|nr:tRNA 2-thiocytidine biosynthesis TtcA family protein [Bacillota bacterium]
MIKNYLSKPYHTKLWRAIYEYGLIEPGDRILIGLSGGKDSMFLTYALSTLRSYSDIPFEIEAVTVDIGFPNPLNVDRIKEACAAMGVTHHIVPTKIAQVIEERRGKTNPCAVCSYFRRAAMNRFAFEHGFNKVALAHHEDDAIETFLMNILYAGKLCTLPWKTTLTRTAVTVIRPMMYLSEKDVIKAVKRAGIEAVPSCCPHSSGTMRARVKRLVLELVKENKMVRANLVASMRNGNNVELWPPIGRHNRQNLC